MEIQYNDVYTPPPFKICQDCGGSGEIPSIEIDGNDPSVVYKCHCRDGLIPIYYTIEHWEHLTKRKLPVDMPVWELVLDWTNGDEEWYARIKNMVYPTNTMIVATEAGRPPTEWRPK